MIVDRSSSSLIATVRLLDDTSTPIPSVVFSDGTLDIAYKKHGDSVWTELTLVAGTLGTWISSGFIEDSGGNGLYELGIPNAASIPGKRTYWRFRQGGNQYRYDSIDYVAIPAASSDTVDFNIQIPGVGPLFSTNPNLYIKELNVDVVFVANQDITSETLVIIFETSDNVDAYVITDGSITKSGNEATITLPAGFTDNTKTLNWAVREATNKTVYGTGSISVSYAPHED